MIFDICAAYTDLLYSTYVPVLVVVFRTKIRNNCSDSFVLRVFLICYLKLVFIFIFLCVFFVCIFSLFNIINIVSYIEIISVFNDFSYYRQYAPTKDNKIVSPVTIIKNISIFWSLRIPHLASFKGYVGDVIGRRYDKVKDGHIFEN
jgi:hypothetical protein